MEEQNIKPVEGLRLVVENGEVVLKNNVNGAEITMHFAKEPPARNAKEACLSILTNQYQ